MDHVYEVFSLKKIPRVSSAESIEYHQCGLRTMLTWVFVEKTQLLVDHIYQGDIF